MTYEDWVPLKMGDKLVGKARVDLETGLMEGKLDPEFAGLLNGFLPNGLTDISFTGRAGFSTQKVEKDLNDWLEGSEAVNGTESS